jgi:integral membrane protein (TIGR01906 family)
MKWFLTILNAISLLVVVVLTSIEIPTFTRSFYSKEYDKYHISEQIHVTKSDLMAVTEKLLNYMGGRDSDLVIETTVAGRKREFFNQKEKDHMVDVKNLFAFVFWARNIALLIFCFSLILLYILYRLTRRSFLLSAVSEEKRMLARAYQIVFAAFVIISAILIFFIVGDFDHAFTVFHELFFDNSLWILDPKTDLLVNIVPTGFFIDIAIRIAAVLTSLSTLILVGTSVYLYLHKPIRYLYR